MKVATNVKPKKGKKVVGLATTTVKKGEPVAPKTPRNVNTRFASPVMEQNATAADRAKSKGHFDSGAAPRVGTSGHAPVATQGALPMGGTKKQISMSRKNVNKSAASPQAKRSARLIYKR